MSSACRSAVELPMIGLDMGLVRSWLSSSLSVLFSATSAWRSAAFCTLLTICMRLRGFSTKSYAPARIASTAVSIVP
jgi:hypothetical protein